MAPEQVEGRACDARTDLFALGAVLYECATGEQAFASDSVAGTFASIMDAPPPQLRTLDASPLSAGLTRVVRRLIARDPEERYQSARDVALELREQREDRRRGALSPPAAATSRRAWLPWLLTASLAALSLVLVWPRFAGDATTPGGAVVLEAGISNRAGPFPVSFSSDESALYFAGGMNGHLTRRDLDRRHLVQIADTERSMWVDLAPDSQSFYLSQLTTGIKASASIRNQDGSLVADLGEVWFVGGDWADDGQIYYSPMPQSGLPDASMSIVRYDPSSAASESVVTGGAHQPHKAVGHDVLLYNRVDRLGIRTRICAGRLPRPESRLSRASRRRAAMDSGRRRSIWTATCSITTNDASRLAASMHTPSRCLSHARSSMMLRPFREFRVTCRC